MELSILGLCLGLLLLVVPLFIMYRYRLKILPKALMGITKMIVYLCVTGFFLKYVFEWNNTFINLLWMILLVVLASFTTIIKAKLKLSRFFVPVCSGILVSAVVVGIFFLLFVTGLKNPFDARYFIPVVSLLIGNMMEVNYKALSVYYMGLKYHNQLYYYLLGNGATHSEAVSYFVRRALEKVSIQNIANMAVIVVGLSPLVMWSMLLSGASVLVAVEYQILIMIATFCVSMISVVITLWVARHYSFDEYGQIKDAVQHIDVNQSL